MILKILGNTVNVFLQILQKIPENTEDVKDSVKKIWPKPANTEQKRTKYWSKCSKYQKLSREKQ